MKNKETPDAIRINPKGAILSKPTDVLITEMAQGIYIAVTTSASISMGSDVAVPWKDLDDNVKDFWLSGSRSAYAVIALHGGGKLETIEDAE